MVSKAGVLFLFVNIGSAGLLQVGFIHAFGSN